jgi:two-component system sensor histidine kinase PhoQ
MVAAGMVVAAFLGATGAALDFGYRESARAAARDRLQAELNLLVGAADPDGDLGLTLPAVLPDPRLASPGSGVYAEVVDAEGGAVWRSWSLLGVEIPFPPPPDPGHPVFASTRTPDGVDLLVASLSVAWEVAPGQDETFTFRVAEARAVLDAQVGRFRQTLWGWLAAAAAALLAVQGVVLRWGLKPLRRVAGELEEVEAGRRTHLGGPYPPELRPLTQRLNALVEQAQARLDRHRGALADLAHSLKTPLSVLRGAVAADSDAGLREAVQQQVERMDQVVAYQLHRAATSGRISLSAPVPVAPAVERVVATVTKVHAARPVAFEVHLADGLRFRGEEGDLLEVLGNLIDNAAKWARSRVRVEAVGGAGLVLSVEDDGPGIPAAALPGLLRRGARADPATPGHGIGLAVVRDIVEGAYGGRLVVANRAEGGLRAEARFPDATGTETDLRGPGAPERL